jgi:hypothetical protein
MDLVASHGDQANLSERNSKAQRLLKGRVGAQWGKVHARLHTRDDM